MIQHQVNHDAGDGNVEPHGQRPARDPFVPDKVAAFGAEYGDDDKWDDDDRQERVRREDREIDRARNSLPREPRHAVM